MVSFLRCQAIAVFSKLVKELGKAFYRNQKELAEGTEGVNFHSYALNKAKLI
ncbi:hypothetical protein [Saccharicrinis sp. 156]|uniref:hypothetical protein n=1 Tax=Saccharicrinis sp. 156 TaxID=3417574 RepID=UPI003D34A9D3